MTIADSVWLATAMLHRENVLAQDFSVREIIEKISSARLIDGYRPGLSVFTSKHCVANKSPNPLRHRILLETTRGRRRLFRKGDPFHPDRKDGNVRPKPSDLPQEYRPLVDWYDNIYAGRTTGPEHQADSPTPTAPVDSGVQTSTLWSLPGSSVAFVSSAGAVVLPGDLRKRLGIAEGTRLSIRQEKNRIVLQPVNEDYIDQLRGSCKGTMSMVESREREHRDEKY